MPVYHEGAPGHHLQLSQTLAEQENLNRWQRLMCWVSGYGEGWAFYAERLMGELGYLDDPGAHLGMLDAQLMSATTWPWTSGCTWSWRSPRARAGGRASAGTLRSPGSSCGPTPAGTKSGCASSCTATWAGPGRFRPTNSASGSDCRPGTRPRPGAETPSASKTSTPRRSARAPWAWTCCVRPWPASRGLLQRKLRGRRQPMMSSTSRAVARDKPVATAVVIPP